MIKGSECPMENVKLISPWINYYKEIQALFKDDPQIEIAFDEDRNQIKLFVDNEEKADALAKLLPMTRSFGNVTVTTTVIPADGQPNTTELYRKAFTGNPAFSRLEEEERIVGGRHAYVIFASKVVQYFNDDISDYFGWRSTLYQDIAKDVFGESATISFCTEKAEKTK